MSKETGMSIVTISRGSFSRGKEVAEALARELEYECISRDILLESSDHFKIPEIKLTKALHDAPTLQDLLSHGQEHYIDFFKASFLAHMAKGNIVYHGLAGHFFLQGIPHVLKVRINANIEDRIVEEMKRENCSKSAALHNLKKDDKERRKWGLKRYGKDTWDSRLYDIVLCVDSLSVDDIVEILVNIVRKRQFQETEQSRAELQNRLLRANVQSLLTTTAPHAKVDLVNDSRIELSNVDGRLSHSKAEREQLVHKMKEELGVEEIIFKEPTHPYKGHINTFYNIDVQQ